MRCAVLLRRVLLLALRDGARQRLARVLRLLRAIEPDAAVLHDDHARREAGDVGLVRDEHDGDARCDRSSWNSAITSMLVSRVEVAGRLVGEDHLRAG